MFREYAEIISNDCIGKEHYLMRIRASILCDKWMPGQFINVYTPACEGSPELLRRPFSILSCENGFIDFVYRVVGCGTRIMSEMSRGQKLDIIGPLGKGFETIPEGKGKHILICGGVGAPPIIALAGMLLAKDLEVEFYQGARDTDSLILHEKLRSMRMKYIFATEDGSKGHTGLVSELLPENKKGIVAAYACGPLAMLKAILKWRDDSSFKYFTCVENKMACGVGVCLGCSVPTVDGRYLLACTDGPVFDADLIDWRKF